MRKIEIYFKAFHYLADRKKELDKKILEKKQEKQNNELLLQPNKKGMVAF